MASKKNAATKPKAPKAMTKAEACKILQVAPAAESELVAKAYWHLAREARAFAKRDPAARRRLDELNRAYLVLNPGLPEAPFEKDVPPEAPAEPPSSGFDEFFAWLRRIVQQTKQRWPQHGPEITILTATTVALTFLALDAGADALWTFIAAGAAALAIWAPWRRA